jgi:hypothetical protein
MLPAGLLFDALHAVIHAMSFERDWSARLYVRPVEGGTELLAIRPHGAARVIVPTVLPELQIGYTTAKRILDLAAKCSPMESVTVGQVQSEDPVFRVECSTAEGDAAVEMKVQLPLPPPDTRAIFDSAYALGAQLTLPVLAQALETVQRIGGQDPLRDLFALEFRANGLAVTYEEGVTVFTKFVPCSVEGEGRVRIRGEALARALRPLNGRGTLGVDLKNDRIWIEAPFGGLSAHTAVVSTLRDARSIP